MPTYVYRRSDGTTFEIQQRITEEPLTSCPETGQSVVRVISANTGLIFKGSGFYLTDYARNGSAKSTPSADDKTTSETASTKTSSGEDSSKATKEAA
jgi:putative FmdB family regulatory protein